ncbi:hypothetical protein [Xenorhabdus szentirmaii]|uniref:Uncharacterized protein n=1 Tax=Xenorhabdus szentirmaii DSM 16338 TaxID=1427518 RepID=W1ISH0_9GAMM|nr:MULTISPECIES: hypothetical protein [Xenorhabdus]MBD2791538.1 hypothetical protein [Xenorhabdus sp. CUL]MBD2821781.1 hypothetical protein [Xenorhabdus sp. 42]PHM32572.1 hypothetical protein Xsze_03319 [Xenorhabdus szentirmaii DSM 16338]PHM41120.1 hypothetical protein Xszus_00797 [Xenorhabdus szentirmaii]CDL80571.1 hypothetical protein XSR1_10051 [Xenorhabdus szentirmaii DSM 16338]
MSSLTGSICDISNNCQKITLDISSQLPISYDYPYLGKVWGLAFSSVMMLYLFSFGLGQIIRMVKHA